jgi:hypothetical protein
MRPTDSVTPPDAPRRAPTGASRPGRHRTLAAPDRCDTTDARLPPAPPSPIKATVTTQELIVFWRLTDGSRCVVTPHGDGMWELRVVRDREAPMLVENYRDPRVLYERARALRRVFAERAVAREQVGHGAA